MGLFKEYISFLRREKKWWLIPLVMLLLVLGTIIIFFVVIAREAARADGDEQDQHEREYLSHVLPFLW